MLLLSLLLLSLLILPSPADSTQRFNRYDSSRFLVLRNHSRSVEISRNHFKITFFCRIISPLITSHECLNAGHFAVNLVINSFNLQSSLIWRSKKSLICGNLCESFNKPLQTTLSFRADKSNCMFANLICCFNISQASG